MKKIRLGMVRADTHGYYFAMMLDKCNPLLLQKYNYVVHYYAKRKAKESILRMFHKGFLTWPR